MNEFLKVKHNYKLHSKKTVSDNPRNLRSAIYWFGLFYLSLLPQLYNHRVYHNTVVIGLNEIMYIGYHIVVKLIFKCNRYYVTYLP